MQALASPSGLQVILYELNDRFRLGNLFFGINRSNDIKIVIICLFPKSKSRINHL